MKIPASKVPAQVWADKARRRTDLDEEESMLLSSWDRSKQVYRIGKELWEELRIDETDEVPADALLRLPYDCIFIERRWVDEYEELLTAAAAGVWGESRCDVTRYYEGCFCWVEGRTLFVSSLTHHCEMTHTDGYGARSAEVICGMQMWLDTIALPIDEGVSLARWCAERRDAVLKENEFISYACEVTDEELLAAELEVVRADSYLLEHFLGCILYISSKEADVRTVYVPQKVHLGRAGRPIAPSLTLDSASPRSSRRFGASTSMTRRGRMTVGTRDMWHPMSGAVIGTGIGPDRGETRPVLR